MHKDVIYIDTEDDITAIIGKIKASKEKIIALVPPKRIGALQSAVNLRLLARITENSNKHLVIVTNNKPLIALAASAMIPVAKNLQSKPEIAEVEAIETDDEEDVIEGAQMPVGDLAKTADKKPVDDVTEAMETIDIDGDMQMTPEKDNIGGGSSEKRIKVPDFPSFRKKLFIGIFLLLALSGFLVWAIVYAPAAKIIITAKTSEAKVSLSVKLGGSVATDTSKNIIQTLSKELTKDVSVTFTATGKKDVGSKAVGVITVENCDDTSPFVIPAGTTFTALSGEKYTSDSQVTVPGLSGKSSECQINGTGAGTVEMSVTAIAPGEDYNIAENDYINAFYGNYVYFHGTDMAGGTSKLATVVTAEDIVKAKEALNGLSNDSVKSQLISGFTNGELVINDSFKAKYAEPVSTPAVGEEVTSGAKLTSATTFTITAIAKSEIQTYLKSAIEKQMDSDGSQRIYSDGIDTVKLSGYYSSDDASTVNISATGKIGPNIKEADIKEQAKGKRYGDVQAQISAIDGVSSVDIQFPYFWVRTVPNDASKITVEFELQDE